MREGIKGRGVSLLFCWLIVGKVMIAQTVIPPQPSGAPLTVETGKDNGFLACAVSALNAELQHGTTDDAFSGLAGRANLQSQAMVSGHGLPGSICTGGGNRCVFAAMTEFNESAWGISADRIAAKFASLMLLSCDTGAEVQGAKLLYRIARHVHIPVSAPTYLVWCGNGRVWIDPNSDVQTATDVGQPATKPKPTVIVPITTIYRLRMPNGWISVLPSQAQVEQFRDSSGLAGRSRQLRRERETSFWTDEGAIDLSLKIDFANPFQPGGVPAAVATGKVVLNVQSDVFSGRRTFTIYADDVAQDDQFPDTFYRIDSTLLSVMGTLRENNIFPPASKKIRGRTGR